MNRPSLSGVATAEPTFSPETPVSVSVDSAVSSDAAASSLQQSVELGPDVALTVRSVTDAVIASQLKINWTSSARQGLSASHEALQKVIERGDPIYGLTTGFGPFVRWGAADRGGHGHGAGLIAHLGAGSGPDAPEEVVRAAMVVRLQNLAQGHSGIAPEVADAFVAMLEAGIVPCVPEVGSVGASGDLCPLAHIARALTGQGRVRLAGSDTVRASDEVLPEKGLAPLELTGRDALALVNGTAFMSAYAALTAARAEALLRVAEHTTGWLYRSFNARSSAIDPRLHEARGHQGQVLSAKRIHDAAHAQGDYVEDTDRPLQEVYSVRCAPQLFGAIRDQLAQATRTLETEINGVNDNPVVIHDAETPCVLHGGNFQGQQTAFAADMLNQALTQLSVTVERQVAAVLNPSLNGGAPLLLAYEPGPCAGMAGAQLTATALVAEIRQRSLAAATSSIPTNGDNQDVVSMGTTAARAAYEQLPRVEAVIGIMQMCLIRLSQLREAGRAPGQAYPAPDWSAELPFFEEDRALQDDIERFRTHVAGLRLP